MERISNFECRGVEFAEAGNTKPALSSSDRVPVLITMFRNGITRVGCSYLTSEKSDVGEGKCAAAHLTEQKIKLPSCPFLLGEFQLRYSSITSLGLKIETLRKERGLNQARLAEMTGINPATISRLESGKIRNPTQEHLDRLNKALGVDLITGEILG